MFIYTFLLFLRIDKIENNLRYIEPQNGKKFKRTQAEFKKDVSYKIKKVYPSFDVVRIEENLPQELLYTCTKFVFKCNFVIVVIIVVIAIVK